MDVKVIESYCKYIIKPLDVRKSQLERELITAKFFQKSKIKFELEQLNKLLNEKLVRLTELIYDQD